MSKTFFQGMEAGEMRVAIDGLTSASSLAQQMSNAVYRNRAEISGRQPGWILENAERLERAAALLREVAEPHPILMQAAE